MLDDETRLTQRDILDAIDREDRAATDTRSALMDGAVALIAEKVETIAPTTDTDPVIDALLGAFREGN